MDLYAKKRGRPSKAELAARAALDTETDTRTDAELLADVKERFNVLSMLTTAAVEQNVRAVVATGGPGVGKTYTVENVLDAARERTGTQYEIVRGTISPINLYKLGWRTRHPGSVAVLDDADKIFEDEEALNLLKVLCDTSSTRRVSYLKESHALKAEDIPNSYVYNGAMIFISNMDFHRAIRFGGKHSPHFEALMSRSLFLDLRLHTARELGAWVEHVAVEGKILQREGLSPQTGEAVLSFLRNTRDTLNEPISLRTLLKVAQLAKNNPASWEKLATILLTKH